VSRSAPWLLLALGLWCAWLAYNTQRPRYGPPGAAIFTFFAGWLTSELAPQHLLLQAGLTALLARWGALGSWPGKLGLGLMVLSWIGLSWCVVQALRAGTVLDRALEPVLGGEGGGGRPGLGAWLLTLSAPFPLRPGGVERLRDLVFAEPDGQPLRLDIYRGRQRPARDCPVLLEVHGGGWILGDKREQGLPLMYHMARAGWICVTANYRLCPRATMPEPLVDLKHALAWIRRHVADYGGDPSFVVITGGSAGAHLASMAALTPGEPSLQPGFEQAETAVQGCVAFYGVYDLADRHGLWPKNYGLLRLMEERVIKARLAEAPERFDAVSPICHIGPQAPPFLLLHGDRDTLAAEAPARRFADELRAVSRAEVIYARLPGAQHAFDVFPSLRLVLIIQRVERFLTWLHRRHRRSAEPPPAAA
jgi:acetyl esterase/lipase